MAGGLRTASAFCVAIAGAVFALTADAASVVYTYDTMGRIRTASYDNGVCVTYSYDANGNRTAQSNVSGSSGTPTWGSGIWGCFPWTP